MYRERQQLLLDKVAEAIALIEFLRQELQTERLDWQRDLLNAQISLCDYNTKIRNTQVK